MPETWRANRAWNQPKRRKCFAANKAETCWRSDESFDIRHRHAEFGVHSAGLQSCFGPIFLHYISLYFGTVRNILCHYKLEAYNAF